MVDERIISFERRGVRPAFVPFEFFGEQP